METALSDVRCPRAECLDIGLTALDATTSTGTASHKLDSDPLGSQFLNDSADAVARTPRG
jgi:hypothetical protein